jgi:hypothetical protein
MKMTNFKILRRLKNSNCDPTMDYYKSAKLIPPEALNSQFEDISCLDS